MYRSLLYVPASSDRFIAKAAERGADALILDLEDSVALGAKASAREKLAGSVALCGERGADIWVRINRPISLALRDIEAAVTANATGILITKVASADHVRLLLEFAADVEQSAKRIKPIQAIAVIETAAAVWKAESIARADDRVIGVLGGSEDLALSMGAQPTQDALKIPKTLIHLAAVAAGRWSFGMFGTIANYSDTGAIKSLALEARRCGFSGATCVHPTAVPILNETFTPTAAELAEAQAILDAAAEHERRAVGAFSYEGRMIDMPIIERARRLIELAKLLR